MVTSATPGEGKTTTTVNLAIAMATTGNKVLLVDGDLRNPSVARTLGLEGGAGLTTVLLGNAEVADVIQRWRDTSLYVLAAGQIPPTPASCWAPSRCVSFSTSSPTTSTSSWSTAHPSYRSSTRSPRPAHRRHLMVVASHRTKKRDVASAVKQLETVEARLAGFALNFVPINESDPYRHGYYRYQETMKKAEASKSTKVKPSKSKGRRAAK